MVVIFMVLKQDVISIGQTQHCRGISTFVTPHICRKYDSLMLLRVNTKWISVPITVGKLQQHVQ